MFTFAWSELVTDTLLDRLETLAGEPNPADRPPLREVIARILRNAGGFPIVDRDLTDAQKTELADRLLADALGHYLSVAGVATDRPGHAITGGTASLDACLESRTVLDVNRADAASLEALPAIGPALAAAIVRARTDGGYFVSIEELAARVAGVGPAAAQAIRYMTSFGVPIGAAVTFENQGTRLGRLLHRALAGFSADRAGGRLRRLMESVRSVTSRTPHPSTVRRQPRTETAFQLGPSSDAAFVGVLEGASYYERLPLFLRDASTSVKVAMFHAAFPGPNHPTKALLDELIAAKGRGADVKVVLDRDRDTDPYMSVVINTNAKRYLEDHGVACRFDREDVLLHSKYVVIDGTLSIVGSHNWSAGSYSEFDDLSFVVQSPEIAAALTARFEQIWA